ACWAGNSDATVSAPSGNGILLGAAEYLDDPHRTWRLEAARTRRQRCLRYAAQPSSLTSPSINLDGLHRTWRLEAARTRRQGCLRYAAQTSSLRDGGASQPRMPVDACPTAAPWPCPARRKAGSSSCPSHRP